MEEKKTPAFSVKNLAPGWGAAIMGTGVISAMFSALHRSGTQPELTQIMAQIFLFVAVIFALPILTFMLVRWVKYPAEVRADLANPIKGAMLVTFPGGILVLAVTFSRAGMQLFGPEIATALTYFFTAIGGTLALVIGLFFVTGLFIEPKLEPQAISGTWFIPPVVTIIVPTALSPLMSAPSNLASELLWISWAFLGIGSLLYIVVVAALFYRTAIAPLPPAHLAPSLVIGMGPAGLIGLDLFLLAEGAGRIGLGSPGLIETATVAAVMLWGFGLWWGIAAVMVIHRGYGKLPFGVAWWGFTFPLGAWVVAGINIGFTVGSGLVFGISLAGAALLLLVWAVVVVRTSIAISDRTIWAG